MVMLKEVTDEMRFTDSNAALNRENSICAGLRGHVKKSKESEFI